MIVLVSDDVVENRDLLCRFIRLHGHNPITAENGQEAVDLAIQYEPDLIFMDMSMPILSGDQATKLIRSQPAISETPIVAFTAFAREEDKQACFDAGCDKVMTKPIDITQLKEILEHFASPESNNE